MYFVGVWIILQVPSRLKSQELFTEVIGKVKKYKSLSFLKFNS